MKKIKIEYLIDDDNMTDEEYKYQEEKIAYITESDLYEILVYGRFNNQIDLKGGHSIDIQQIQIVND